MAPTSFLLTLSVFGIAQSAQLPFAPNLKGRRLQAARDPVRELMQGAPGTAAAVAPKAKRSAPKKKTRAAASAGEGAAEAGFGLMSGAQYGGALKGTPGSMIGAYAGYKLGSEVGKRMHNQTGAPVAAALAGAGAGANLLGGTRGGEAVGTLGGYLVASMAADRISKDMDDNDMGTGLIGAASGSIIGEDLWGEDGDELGKQVGYVVGSEMKKRLAADRADDGKVKTASIIGGYAGSRVGGQIYGPLASTLGLMGGVTVGQWADSLFSNVTTPTSETALGAAVGSGLFKEKWGQHGGDLGMVSGAAIGAAAHDLLSGTPSVAEMGGAYAGSEILKDFDKGRTPNGRILGALAGSVIGREYDLEYAANER